jgi:hypothetical protein
VKLNVSVVQGQVRVNSVYMHVKHDDCFILEVDCVHKHPELGPMSLGEILLYPNLGFRPEPDTERPTYIKVEGPPAGWTNDAVVSRYSVFIFYWKLPDEPSEPLWEAKD